MSEVFELKKNKTFTLQEARGILPLVKKITQEAVEQTEEGQEMPLIAEKWSEKILKLGCEPKGLWMVDFDNGQGFYCWHYPEEDVDFFHSYQDGFNGRTPIL